ncbi:MAG: thioredoxin [archaeon]
MNYEIEVNDENFEKEVIEKSREIPVVVDFWAPWCVPCQALSPVLEALAEEYCGKFILAKINVEEHKGKAREFKIMSIPCIKMFKNGIFADEFIGVMPEEKVKMWLDKNLLTNKSQ